MPKGPRVRVTVGKWRSPDWYQPVRLARSVASVLIDGAAAPPGAIDPWRATMRSVLVPPDGETWIALTDLELPVGPAYEWAVQPSCGAVVLFSGTVRDHADGRDNVSHLTYEAYEEHALPRLMQIDDEIRTRWPTVGRVALLHRLGKLELGESSVIVVVSSPHRPEAFEAARFGIDALKASVPIWKHEVWNAGADWALGAQHITVPGAVDGNR